MGPQEMQALEARLSQVTNLLVDVTQEKSNLVQNYTMLQQQVNANNKRIEEELVNLRKEIRETVTNKKEADSLCSRFDILIGKEPVNAVDTNTVAEA